MLWRKELNLHIKVNKDIKKIIEISNKFPLQLLAVGGFVRDCLLNRTPKDIDFIVVGHEYQTFEKLMTKIKHSFKLHKVTPACFEEVTRLISSKKCFDFTFVREESLNKNLKNRDFTINSLAWNFNTEKIIDICNGQNDIQNKVIKQINNNCFKEDPIRILRMYRFQEELNFTIDVETEENSIEYLNKITNPSGERIKEELFKILKNDNGLNFADKLFKNIIFHLFPKFNIIKNISQNGYHHLNVLDHVSLVVKYTFQIEELTKLYQNFNIKLKDEDKIALRLAAIFHDLGKGETFKLNEKGLTTFHNHQYVSADLFLESIKYLKLSKNFSERVYFLIRRHMLFLNFMINGYSEKSFRKFINLMREDTVLLLLLVTADKLSAKGPLSQGNMEKLIQVGNSFLDVYNKDKDTILSLPKLITGDEVMEKMEISPSKQVGEIIHKIAEKQLEDKNFTRDDALLLLEKIKTGK